MNLELKTYESQFKFDVGSEYEFQCRFGSASEGMKPNLDLNYNLICV
jgi:hypothetical protein